MSTSNTTTSVQYRLREDGFLFTEDYLTEENRETAENYLWPVPVLERHREDTAAAVDQGNALIRPGDILEYCGERYEEYLLVVAILPKPAQHCKYPNIEDSNRILCYSSNTESYRLFIGEAFITKAGNKLHHPTGEYVLHENAAPLIESSVGIPADVTHPPRPHVGNNGKPSNTVKEKYPHEHPPKANLAPRRALSNDPEPTESFINNIEHGNALDILPKIKTGSVHGWITSPPYYEARDYGKDDQLGHEDSVDEYLESLLTIVNQLMRVTRNDGLGVLIVDDIYQGGSLTGIPHQLHQEVVKQGFEIIHHAPWTKPNGKPEAVRNRYTHNHEHLLIIAHEGGEHFFNKQAADDPNDVFEVEVGNSNTDHDAVFPTELPKQLIRTTIPEKTCPECGSPFEEVHEVTDIRDLDKSRPQAKRALKLAERYDLTDKQLEAIRSVGLGHTGQAKRTQDGTGNNRNETEELAAEAEKVLGSYAREFVNPNKQFTGFSPTCECNVTEADAEPGIVLDPFIGSGTTALAAKQLHRRWIGIELNEEYIASAQSRIGIDVDQPEKLTDDNQNTLNSYCD